MTVTAAATVGAARRARHGSESHAHSRPDWLLAVRGSSGGTAPMAIATRSSTAFQSRHSRNALRRSCSSRVWTCRDKRAHPVAASRIPSAVAPLHVLVGGQAQKGCTVSSSFKTYRRVWTLRRISIKSLRASATPVRRKRDPRSSNRRACGSSSAVRARRARRPAVWGSAIRRCCSVGADR
jgi:hypothetical protein